MWQHFILKNFRCFSGLLIKDLARVNLIAGKNNVGKTALLEGMFLHQDPFNVKKIFEISRFRGFFGTEKYHEELTKWLFWGRQGYPVGAGFESRNQEGKTFCSSIWLVEPAQMMERFEEVEKNLQKSLPRDTWDLAIDRPRLVIEVEEEGKKYSAGAIYQGSSWASFPRPSSLPYCVFLGSGINQDELTVGHFGQVEVEKRQDEIVPILKQLEPRLSKLALVPLAGKMVLHGDIGLPQMIPVQLMGEGVQRILSIVLAIAVAKHGMVLIDEIENGLYYSVMADVWKAIAEAARQADVQVFATTHSYECIQAAHEAFVEGGTYDFALHRLDWEEGGIEAVTYDQESLETGLELYHEVR